MEEVINMQKNEVTDKTICRSGWRLWQAKWHEGAYRVHTRRHIFFFTIRSSCWSCEKLAEQTSYLGSDLQSHSD